MREYGGLQPEAKPRVRSTQSFTCDCLQRVFELGEHLAGALVIAVLERLHVIGFGLRAVAAPHGHVAKFAGGQGGHV